MIGLDAQASSQRTTVLPTYDTDLHKGYTTLKLSRDVLSPAGAREAQCELDEFNSHNLIRYGDWIINKTVFCKISSNNTIQRISYYSTLETEFDFGVIPLSMKKTYESDGSTRSEIVVLVNGRKFKDEFGYLKLRTYIVLEKKAEVSLKDQKEVFVSNKMPGFSGGMDVFDNVLYLTIFENPTSSVFAVPLSRVKEFALSGSGFVRPFDPSQTRDMMPLLSSIYGVTSTLATDGLSFFFQNPYDTSLVLDRTPQVAGGQPNVIRMKYQAVDFNCYVGHGAFGLKEYDRAVESLVLRDYENTKLKLFCFK